MAGFARRKESLANILFSHQPCSSRSASLPSEENVVLNLGLDLDYKGSFSFCQMARMILISS
jgi:hypothetical protein